MSNMMQQQSRERAFPALATPVETNLYCPICQAKTLFKATRFALNGLVGSCAGCGDERVLPYTHTTSAA